jgi:5-(aminomethyl)-3-furanmethanol phosphate kinase
MDTSGAGKAAVVDIVVKIGGGVLAHADQLEAALAAISTAGRDRRLLVVPGGGPFADTVREVDRRIQLSDDVAHWMALLAMDQYAHLVAARLAGSVLVTKRHEIAAALDAPARQIPVLAPYRWLHEADPLPHGWSVTSDSISAWIADRVDARRLILIKPPGARLHLAYGTGTGATGFGETAQKAAASELVDAYFPRALQPHVKFVMVCADQIDALRLALEGRSG